MTASPSIRSSDSSDLAASEAARSAADASVSVELVHDLDGAARVGAVCEATWGAQGVMPLDLTRALAYPSGTVLLARGLENGARFDVGVAAGFLSWADEVHFHSHLVGVVPTHRGAGIGVALKLAQRASCLMHGVRLMRWTFDPLLAPNARLNISRLGGVATRFLPDFYGDMKDSINRGDDSDRVELSWRLDRPLPPKTSGPAWDRKAGALLEVDATGWPRRTDKSLDPGALIAIPRDYGEIRRRRDPRATAWRSEVRVLLASVFAAGLVLEGFDGGNYRIGREPGPGSDP